MHVLALDVSTSCVKSAILNPTTGQAFGDIARVEFALDTPTPMAAEVPAATLWQALARACRTAMQQSGLSSSAGDVALIRLSCKAPSLVLLDKKDRVLAPIWMPMDRRARPIARQVEQAVGPEFLAEIGQRPVPGAISVLGFRQQLQSDPYLLHDVASYLHVNGWLAFHMTGVKAFDLPNACATGLFGAMTDQRWSPRWCEYFEVNPGWLPPVVPGNATVAFLRSSIAAEMGVPGGIPVQLESPGSTLPGD